MGKLPSTVSSLTLGVFFLVTSAAAAALKNYTISVPEGTSDHNDPTLLCTPAGWQDIITFYVGNYVAHVATVVSLPGESTMSTIRASISALFFPTSGLMRGFITICTFASFAKTDLRKAARARALCMVVRNQDWAPRRGNTVRDAYIVDRASNSSSESISVGCSVSAVLTLAYIAAPTDGSISVRVVDALWSTIQTTKNTVTVVSDDCLIHGTSKLPKGYDWAYVSGNVEFDDDFEPSKPAGKPDAASSAVSRSISSQSETPTAISSSYNLFGGLISLGQAFYTSVTLYQSRGDQIDQFGYAAFGLTVAPFVIMSLVNLTANCFAPNYPALYMVETSVMLEAKQRDGCHIFGEVGKLKEVAEGELTSQTEAAEWVQSASFDNTNDDNKLFVEIITSRGTSLQDSSLQETTPLVAGEEDTVELMPRAVKKSAEVAVRERQNFHVLDNNGDQTQISNVICVPCCPQVMIIPGKSRKTYAFGFRFGWMLRMLCNPRSAISLIRRHEFRPDPEEIAERDPSRNKPKEQFILTQKSSSEEPRVIPGEDNPTPPTAIGTVFGLLVALAPVAIVGIMSQFRAGKSTVAQRAWTMSWLGASILAGLPLNEATTPMDKKETEEGSSWYAVLGFFIIFGAPAFGGLVVVGQMFTSYGTCITIP